MPSGKPLTFAVSLVDLLVTDMSADTRDRGVKKPFRRLLEVELEDITEETLSNKKRSISVDISVSYDITIEVNIRGLRITYSGIFWSFVNFFVPPAAELPRVNSSESVNLEPIKRTSSLGFTKLQENENSVRSRKKAVADRISTDLLYPATKI